MLFCDSADQSTMSRLRDTIWVPFNSKPRQHINEETYRANGVQCLQDDDTMKGVYVPDTRYIPLAPPPHCIMRV